MASKFIILERNSGQYLAKTLFKGYYLTHNLVEALKCNTREEANKILDKQKLIRVSSVKINEIDFH